LRAGETAVAWALTGPALALTGFTLKIREVLRFSAHETLKHNTNRLTVEVTAEPADPAALLSLLTVI